jgi:hypothetical protein
MCIQNAHPLICEARIFTNSANAGSMPRARTWFSNAIMAAMASGAA